MLLIAKKQEKLSLNYPQLPLLSGAPIQTNVCKCILSQFAQTAADFCPNISKSLSQGLSIMTAIKKKQQVFPLKTFFPCISVCQPCLFWPKSCEYNWLYSIKPNIHKNSVELCVSHLSMDVKKRPMY